MFIFLLFYMLILIAAAASLSACTPAESETAASASPEPETSPRELPPFLLQTPQPEPKPDEIKATGFIYDYDSLTYELVWSDEFDYEGLPDSAKWNYDTGGSGWGNNELQFYTNDSNAWADGEKLIIEARAEQRGNKDYTSARLISKNKGDWLYGKIEVRAKLPAGLGTWPAIWMLPTDWEYGGWPASGEIDIMEHVGYDQDKVHVTVHTEAFNHRLGTQKGSGGIRKEGVSENYHTYSIEWLPDRIFFFIDGGQVYEYDPSKHTSTVTYKEWPFDKRFHLLMNIAFGGDWGGARGIDPEVLPAAMEIDYVRVYQSPEIEAAVKAAAMQP